MKPILINLVGYSIALSLILFFSAFSTSINAQTVKVAAVQMLADSGDVTASLKKAETFIRIAFEQGAELVVLPESFTVQAVAVDYNMGVVEAVRPLGGEPLELLKNLAKEYGGVNSFKKLTGLLKVKIRQSYQ